MPAGWESPTAFMTRPTIAAPSASAFLTTRQPSPLIPSPPGGNGRERVVTAARPNFWCWPTPAAATVALPGSGRSDSRLKYAIPSESPLPSLTTPPEPRSGIPSSTGSSPRFPKLGGRATRHLREDAQIHSHNRHENRLDCHRLPRPERLPNPPQTRPTVDLIAPPHTWQSTPAMELYDSTESVKLFLRLPLGRLRGSAPTRL